MALGLVSLQMGQLDEGAKRFASALRADPGARIPSVAGGRDVSRDAQSLFDEAQRQVAGEGTAPEAANDAPTAAPRPDGPAAGEHRDAPSPHVAHVTFVPPRAVPDLVVTLDGRVVPSENLGFAIPVNPGRHTIHAEGTINEVPMVFNKEFDAEEAETVGVVILLAPARPEYVTAGQLKCMLAAKSQQELLECLPQNRRGLDIWAALETSGYTDTNHVNVLTPAIHGAVSSPTAGWNVSGSYLVDVVSAASPDIVSEASPPSTKSGRQGALGAASRRGGSALSSKRTSRASETTAPSGGAWWSLQT